MKIINNIKINIYKKEFIYRFFYINLSFFLSWIILYTYIDELIFIGAYPLQKIWYSKNIPFHFIYTHLTDIFWIQLKITTQLAFILTIPILFFHIYQFLKPALIRKEKILLKTILLIFISFSFISFYINYYYLIPHVWSFFILFQNNANNWINILLEPKIDEYYNFIIIWFNVLLILFQIPTLLFLFFYLKIINIKNLILFRKIIYFLFLVISTFISPPDIISQLVLWIFMIFFYEFSIILFLFYENYIKFKVIK
jgi:sec-independent protein translocase protein TatC